MTQVDKNAPSQPASRGGGGLWAIAVCSLAGMFAALVLCASLLAQKHPSWLVIGAGLAVFPALPLLWHGLADGGAGRLTPRSRFALRCLAVALVVLGVSLGDLGHHRVGQDLRALVGRIHVESAKPDSVPYPQPARAQAHGLETFIPADATLAVGLAGSAVVEQLLAAHGVDTREQLAALATCKIDLASARILVAGRGSGTRMIVLRAPGIGDERNLYCLVGISGPERLQLRADGAGGGKTLQVNGLLAHALTFRLFDERTLIATDPAWQETVEHKLFTADLATATGPLARTLLRVDRTTLLWGASVDETLQGTWDLALDSRQEGNLLELRGSSTPPSGEADRAQLSLRVPVAFAQALPENAVTLGIRGGLAALIAIGGSSAPVQALPVPSRPDGAVRREDKK